MRLNQLVSALADRISPDLVSVDDILATAFQTRLIARNAMMSAARVQHSGNGLHDAARDIASMAELVTAHANTIDDGLTECLACLDSFKTLFDDGAESLEPLSDRVAFLRSEFDRVGERLAQAIKSLPDSMSRDVADVSIDRIQLECLLKQTLVNARDRLRAAALALSAVDDAVRQDGVAQLETIDTDRLVDSVRHRLAVLSRDADLGAAIRQQGAG